MSHAKRIENGSCSKAILALLSAFFFGSFYVQAQSNAWHPIPDSLPSLFKYADRAVYDPSTPGSAQVLGIGIDSIRTLNNDTHYFPTPILRDTASSSNESCYDSTAGGIIGERVIEKDSGTFLFFNGDGDTVHLKTRADSGARWPLYHYPSGDTLFGEVLSVVQDSVLGQVDSIKTIALERIDDSTGTIVSGDNINDLRIRIARDQGLVEAPSIYSIPENEGNYRLFRRSLLTRREIYDRDVGDRVHYREQETYYPNFHIKWEEASRHRIVDKESFPSKDSVHYRIRVKRSYNGNITTDTIERGHGRLSEPFLETLPGELIPGFNPSIYSLSWKHCNELLTLKVLTPDIVTFDSCYTLFEPLPEAESYTVGLGRIGYFNWTSPGVEVEMDLEYYDIGNKECGQKVPLSILEGSSERAGEVRISPNPFDQGFSIRSPLPVRSLELRDLQGRVVERWARMKRPSDEEFRISVGDIPPGPYLLVIRTPKGPFRHKLIKQ